MQKNPTSPSGIFNPRVLVAFTLSFVAVAAVFGGVDSSRFSAFANLPLSFEPNLGQIDPAARFIARASGATFYFTPSGFVSADLQMKLRGGRPAREIAGIDRVGGESNYFIGNDPAKWKTDVPQYARVKYVEVYSGIDLIFHGNQRQLEYDFVVAPGSDPKRIRFAFAGASRLRIDKDGALVVRSKHGNEIRQHRPVIYQEIDGERREVTGGYLIKGPREVGFKVSAYDHDRALVIDPVLSYSTYLGGITASAGSPKDNGAQAIAVDASGNIYVAGFTSTIDFPTANPEQPAYGGGLYDVFVTKFDPSGSTLVYSTYLGGTNADKAFAIAVDSQGNAYVTGFTQSPNFPVTPTAVQAISTTGVVPGNSSDAFVTKLNPAGNTLVYSTFLGGSTNAENAYGIAVDSSGCAYVTGETASTDFPTKNPYQPSLATGGLAIDAFVTKLSADGSALVYSTYLGGGGSGSAFSTNGIDEGFGIAVDSSGSAYVVGYTYSSSFPTQNPLQANVAGDSDIFVTKFSPAGNTLIYSTYLGGSGLDNGFGIAVDASGSAYITGKTASTDFPTVNAFQSAFGGGNDDAFVAKLNPAGSALVYSTYLGGSGSEGNLSRIALNSSGDAYIVGKTDSRNFPTANPIQSVNRSAGDNAFVTKLNAAGNGLVYSTYLGGSTLDFGFGIAVDSSGNAYIAGQTFSGDFPTVNPFQGSLHGYDDAFIAKIVELPVQPLSAVSRKIHGSAGTFDVDLPLTGTPGIECRSDSVPATHQVVITFAAPVTVTDATVTPGPGGTASIILAPGADHSQVIATLRNVSNAQTLTINLLGVSDGSHTADVHIPMSVLIGDTNANGAVSNADVASIRAQVGATVIQSNFRNDVNANGTISNGDVAAAQAKVGAQLPASP